MYLKNTNCSIWDLGMKGKTRKINNLSKGLLLAVSFVLTIVLTATLTLAWFYDTDWASSTATMAGAVGIEMRDHNDKVTSGEDQLHFIIATDLAYPGQAIDVSASVFNNGGSSIVNYFKDPNNKPTTPGGTTDANGYHPTDDEIAAAGDQLIGSACYIRAHFAVYTNIGTRQDDPNTNENEADPETEKLLNAQGLYEFMVGLIETQNSIPNPTYRWVYYRNENAVKLLQGKYYYNGNIIEPAQGQTVPNQIIDEGYFYLCYTDGYTMLPLKVGDKAAFLWNDTFVLPWQLTNASADRSIFVGLSFQAVQTFIPVIDGATGVISKLADNRLKPELCYYYDNSVQTVFNTSFFEPIDTVIDDIDYSDESKGYVKASVPSDPLIYDTINGGTAPTT